MCGGIAGLEAIRLLVKPGSADNSNAKDNVMVKVSGQRARRSSNCVKTSQQISRLAYRKSDITVPRGCWKVAIERIGGCVWDASLRRGRREEGHSTSGLNLALRKVLPFRTFCTIMSSMRREEAMRFACNDKSTYR